MSWRYQPFFEENDDGPLFFIGEVYFDAEGNLEAWTNQPEFPSGENQDEMTSDLTRMIVDCWSWEAVNINTLSSETKFERRISMEDRNEISSFIATVGGMGIACMSKQKDPN